MLAAKFLVGLAAMATLGATGPIKTGPGTTSYDGPPPARYVRVTMVAVLFTDKPGLKAMCGEAKPPLTRMGCTLSDKEGRPLIVMPHPHLVTPAYAARYAGILDHELGHVNSWPGDHTP